jgi:hypothetical protein
MPELEIHCADDWAGLYVDGHLDRVGDAGNTIERALDLAGVKTVDDDAFMRGQNQAAGVAPTLADVEAYRAARTGRQAAAAGLRARAAELAAQADAIEKGADALNPKTPGGAA